MTQKEFETRVKMPVSPTEFEAVHTVYMKSDLEKDEFCKVWSSMNVSRIRKQKRRTQSIKMIERDREKLFKMQCMRKRFSDWEKPAVEFFGISNVKVLSGLGIDTDKCVYDIINDISGKLSYLDMKLEELYNEMYKEA